jgi:hypothetical protein
MSEEQLMRLLDVLERIAASLAYIAADFDRVVLYDEDPNEAEFHVRVRHARD